MAGGLCRYNGVRAVLEDHSLQLYNAKSLRATRHLNHECRVKPNGISQVVAVEVCNNHSGIVDSRKDTKLIRAAAEVEREQAQNTNPADSIVRATKGDTGALYIQLQ